MEMFFEKVSLYYSRLERKENIINKSLNFLPPNRSLIELEEKNGLLKDRFLEFYGWNDGMNMEWSSDLESSKSGRIRILKLQYFLDGIKIQEPHLTVDDELFYFHPIDLFADEAHCGVFIRNGKIEDRMFFHRFGETEVYDLKIDFYTYLQLANMARGYFYWPKYLLEKITGEKSLESDDFQKNMPEIFPDFKLEEFDKLFETSRK